MNIEPYDLQNHKWARRFCKPTIVKEGKEFFPKFTPEGP